MRRLRDATDAKFTLAGLAESRSLRMESSVGGVPGTVKQYARPDKVLRPCPVKAVKLEADRPHVSACSLKAASLVSRSAILNHKIACRGIKFHCVMRIGTASCQTSFDLAVH